MKLMTRILSLLLVTSFAASAHPGHSVFDMQPGMHAGHEGEILLVILPLLGVLCFAVRAFFAKKG
jgi:hypothetical protein